MALGPGASFPSLLLPRVGGGSVGLPTGPGLIFFFRVDCGASAHAADAVARIAEYLLPRGLTVVGVSQDDEGDTAAFASAHRLGAIDLCVDVPSCLASETVALALTPTCWLIDEGRVVAMAENWSRRDYNALAAEAARLVGAPAPTASPASDGLPDHEAGLPARNAG